MRLLPLVISLLAVALAACGSTSNADEEAIAAAVRSLTDAENANDVEAFLGLVTDDYIADSYSPPPTRDQIRQNGILSAGEPVARFEDLSQYEVSDAAATVQAWMRNAHGAARVELSLVKQGDAWILDGLDTLKVDTPSRATEVVVETVDNLYEFADDADTFPAGDIAFQVTNNGIQPHDMFVVGLPEGVTVEAAYDTANPADVGAEYQGLFGAVKPGGETTWLLEGLEPGRYGYFCWVWDPRQGSNHAYLGMAGEFTVE